MALHYFYISSYFTKYNAAIHFSPRPARSRLNDSGVMPR